VFCAAGLPGIASRAVAAAKRSVPPRRRLRFRCRACLGAGAVALGEHVGLIAAQAFAVDPRHERSRRPDWPRSGRRHFSAERRLHSDWQRVVSHKADRYRGKLQSDYLIRPKRIPPAYPLAIFSHMAKTATIIACWQLLLLPPFRCRWRAYCHGSVLRAFLGGSEPPTIANLACIVRTAMLT
jgi:hypothetical protein